jgi:hypothetical protein
VVVVHSGKGPYKQPQYCICASVLFMQ